jgi:penicillin-binding protein 1A
MNSPVLLSKSPLFKKIILGLVAICILGFATIYFAYTTIKKSLPEIIKLEDYKPLLVSSVFDRNGKKIGEFFRERRQLIPYKEIPEHVVKAFLAAEDDKFFEHRGINLQALFRAAIANMRAGRSVQGGSTITQQVAKTLLLSNEKSYARKARDILLALQMEKNLSKEDILYLYLNQIYFGQRSYGIEIASQTYFRKPARQLTVPEAAILAGLPKAPSDFSPVRNPTRAKERQIYVLNRMAELKYITDEQAKEFINEPLKVYLREDYEEKAPYYMETIRQLLVEQLGEDVILNQGVKIVAGLDLEKQIAANEAVQRGLKETDKRQGFRGPIQVYENPDEVAEFLLKEKKKLIAESNPERTILPDGSFAEVEIITKKGVIKDRKNVDPSIITNLPSFLSVGEVYTGIVKDVNDKFGYAEVELPDAVGIIELETMTWARKVNFEVRPDSDQIKKVSQALKKGDQILVKIIADKFEWKKPPEPKNKKGQTATIAMPELNAAKHLRLELDQEPLLEGSLLSIDQESQDLLAMVGGYSFARNEYNRALQAARQTGSLFKALVYAAALEKNYNPSSRIIDAPIVYKETGGDEGQGDEKIWSPSNHSKNFSGEITMRNALVQSLNIPSVKIVQDIGVTFATEFAKRLGIFSKLNPDFTLVLGSSSVTLYEMTKAFSQLGRLGLRTRPIIVKKVTDSSGKSLLENLSLDIRYRQELDEIDDYFSDKRKDYQSQEAQLKSIEEAEKAAADAAAITPTDGAESNLVQTPPLKMKRKLSNPFFFANENQLIKPEIAYVITDMLRGAVTDSKGTAQRAAALGRDVAAKTGSTNGYFDAWFVGYTKQIATGVWVGFDKERSIGKGEVGGRAALPIWLDYMKIAHTNLPEDVFAVPEGVTSVELDADSGRLANTTTARKITQAFVEGTEPNSRTTRSEEATDFLKQDLEE